MLELFSNTLLQALTFGIAGVGIAVAFRVIRYPDLTADGSFMLGSTVFAFAMPVTGLWLALAMSMLAGASAGVVTSVLNSWFRVSRLLSGIITTMIGYSLAFRFLGGRSNVGFTQITTIFSPAPGHGLISDLAVSISSLAAPALFAFAVALLIRQMLRSELGLLLRSTGSNPRLVIDLGRSPAVYQAIGLAVANGLIGLAAALISIQQGFVDINLGVGVVITLIAALVLGEEAFNLLGIGRRDRHLKRVVGPFVGATIYFLLYLLILRGSIRGWIPVSVQPTDLKLLTAVLVVAVVALRRTRTTREEILPL
jgi:putative ABC transport system permease protein